MKEPHLRKLCFNSFLGGGLVWLNGCKPEHLIGVVRWRFLVVVQLPGIPLPPGAAQLMPKILTVPLSRHKVCRKLALKEVLLRALEVFFRAPSLAGGALYRGGEFVLELGDIQMTTHPFWPG
jgi:hypothetical protein